MAVKNYYPKKTNDVAVQRYSYQTADSTNIKNIITASSGQDNETRVYSILIQNKEASTRVVNFFVNDGTEDLYIGSSDAVAAIAGSLNGKLEMIDPVYSPLNRITTDEFGRPYLWLLPGEILKGSLSVAVTTNNYLVISCVTEKFTRSA